MKSLFTFLIFTLPLCLMAQSFNGEFENEDESFSNAGWETTCSSIVGVPEDDGTGFYALLEAGNAQACFPGQMLAPLTEDQLYGLTFDELYISVLARTDSQNSPGIISLEIAYQDEFGDFITIDVDTTSSTNWTFLEVVLDEFPEGMTPFVILDAGLTGGPAIGYAHFDKVAFAQLVDVDPVFQDNHVVSLFPNPAKTSFSIDLNGKANLEEVEIEIYDVLGKLLLMATNIQPNSYQIDVNSFTKGIFLVKISQKGKDLGTQKLIIE